MLNLPALEDLAARALQNAGARAGMAAAAARALVATESFGVPSHGVARVPFYCAMLRNGRADGQATPTPVSQNGAVCLLDNRDALVFATRRQQTPFRRGDPDRWSCGASAPPTVQPASAAKAIPWAMTVIALSVSLNSPRAPVSTQATSATSDAAVNVPPTGITGNLPLEQLSRHNVNVAAFYEKGPISIRAAYNWRSRFLLTAADVIFPYFPIFNDETGQLDASIFFSITDNLKIGVQGVNLLNEVTRTLQQFQPGGLIAPRSYFVNDRRFAFILRGNF
jgi:hypothetical protein